MTFKTTVKGLPVTVTYRMDKGRILGVGTFHAEDITTNPSIKWTYESLRALENESLDHYFGNTSFPERKEYVT